MLRAMLLRQKQKKGLNANLTGILWFVSSRITILAMLIQNPSQITEQSDIGFTMPILDWGLGQGKYKMAQSSLELAQVQVKAGTC